MTPITHTEYNDTVAQELANIATAVGLEVSDDRNYRVTCDHLCIPETGIVAYALRYPESVVDYGPNSGSLIVVDYNDGQSDVFLSINSTVYGKGVKFEGLPDHPHMSMVLLVRQYVPDPIEEDENDRLFNQRNCVTDHCGREFWTNGYGEPL